MPNSEAPTTSTRRALVRGAAWSVPAVAVATAAPAIAASTECVPQSAAEIQTAWRFNGSISNWSQTRVPQTSPLVEYRPTSGSLTNLADLVADPPANTATETTLLSPTVCLAPGTYTFAFDSNLYNANARNLQLRANVQDAVTSSQLGNLISFTTTSGASTTRRGDTVTVTVTRRTSVRFRYRFNFTAAASGAGDDIGVTAPRVTKTA